MKRIFLLFLLVWAQAFADTNSLTDRATGETITASFFNDIHDALSGTVVPRNSSGAPTTGGGDIGSATYRWGALYAAAGNLSGLQAWSLARTSTYGASYHDITGCTRMATNTIICSSGGGYPYIGYNARATSTTAQNEYDATDSAAILQFGTGAAAGAIFRVAGSGTAGNTITWTDALAITSAGKVTIQASATGQTLALNGATTAAGASTATLTNAPAGAATNPDIWMRITYNGTEYIFPGWTP